MARRHLEKLRPYLLVLAGALLGFLAMASYLAIAPPSGRYSDNDIRRLAGEQIASVTPTPPIAPQVYALVRPSVVLISRPDNTDGKNGRTVGAGVVVDTTGFILTAYHVVAGADTVSVRFFDGTVTTGTIFQKQQERDLALVQVKRIPDGVEPATLGGGVGQGDQVMAIGAPFGLDGSVSLGIVSALGRTFVVEETGQQLTGMIQFDAAVNPGNSGGPLVDMNGRVVGIVTGIINPTGQTVFIGIGFAVPIEAAGVLVPGIG